jgi:TIR domain
MPEEKRPDLHFHWEAANELEARAKRADYKSIRDKLQELAEILARNDVTRPEDMREIVERKHVLRAAEKLFADPAALSLESGACVFLSYSTKDEDFARELEANLRAVGVSSFLAPLTIRPGASWAEEIWQAIRACSVFVLVVTAEAIKSKWCLMEIGAALGLRKRVVSVLRHSAKLPDPLKNMHAKKVQTTKQLADLVQQLKKMCSG